jgi:hypothetical protein
MAKFLRYALATFCFAASAGCLALWGWSAVHDEQKITAIYRTTTKAASASLVGGGVHLNFRQGNFNAKRFNNGLLFESIDLHGIDSGFYPAYIQTFGLFGRYKNQIHFPLWYPALVFALAGVAALRFRRQFSIRSALVGLTVVAALLGTVVTL